MVKILGRDNPFLLKIKFAFYDDNHLYIRTDFMQGGYLESNIIKNKRFDENNNKFYAIKLILAIKSLYEEHIIHFDLKCSNILVDSEWHNSVILFHLKEEENL